MSELEKESLSALLDNEADDLEVRRILKSCEQNPQLLETWERFSLVQSLLHEDATPVAPSMAASVAAQIGNESLPVPTESKTASSWQQNLSKMAIAASVALVFIIGVQSSLNDSALPIASQESPPANLAVAESNQFAEYTPTAVDPIAQKRLEEYIQSMAFDEEEPVLMEHIQDSPLYRLVNELEAKPAD